MITLTAKLPNGGHGKSKSTSQLTSDTPCVYKKLVTSHHQLIHQKQSEEKATVDRKFSPPRLTPSKPTFPQTVEKVKQSAGDVRQTEENNLTASEKSSIYMSSASITKQTPWSSNQPSQQDGITPLEPASSFPTLFDILHHCNINRVLLDPNIPSSNNQLGLRLCMTKFPLDDIQRANHLQRMKEEEIKGVSCADYERVGGFNSTASPQGPKPQLLPRHGGPFRAVEYRRLDDAPDVITIESIQPNTPASIEGSLSTGMLILEINGQQLLHPKSVPKGGSRVSMLRIAEDQLRMAYQAAKHGQVPMVRITAARFHNKFGIANQLARWNRFSTLGVPENDGILEQEESIPEPKLPNSLLTVRKDPANGRAPRKPTRRNAPNAFSKTKYLGSESSHLDTYSPWENATDTTSTVGNTDAESIREKLMWFPSWTVPCKQQQQQREQRKMNPTKLHWGMSTSRNGDYDSQYSTFTK
ncbi:uncharacterized protein DEA37_0002305 [Paragonimus westermani]|uniref:PDZ domain-containing protein n=1 Tax=Paragonimus westermani TaxID=34504 RepID=A0A5J4NKP2_9TREM|nr:uncharacterized protein DEA37_0002305 [Paragonimus westermani]